MGESLETTGGSPLLLMGRAILLLAQLSATIYRLHHTLGVGFLVGGSQDALPLFSQPVRETQQTLWEMA